MPEQPIHVRQREATDLDQCVRALAEVHRGSGYPTIWPADPARWLTPSRALQAWVATTNEAEAPIAGHVIVRQPPPDAPSEHTAELSRLFVVPAARRRGVARALLAQAMRWAANNQLALMLEVTGHLQPARALYERTGFRLTGTRQATWATPDGHPVTLHQYAWPGEQG